MNDSVISNGLIGYPALFRQVESKKYYIEFPDLEGCYTQGDTLEEAICRAQDALAVYYSAKKGELPPASDLKSIQNRNTDTIVQIIVVDTNGYIVKPVRTVRKTLTVPAWLNELAEKYQVNFSQALKTGLINHLKNLDSISSYDRKMLAE